MLHLYASIFRSTLLSLALFVAALLGFFVCCDPVLEPKYRVPWGLGHGGAHITAALSCAIFVELAIEWSVHMGVGTTMTHDSQLDGQCEARNSVGQSMLHEYNEIFKNSSFEPFFQRFSSEAADKAAQHLVAAGEDADGLTALVADMVVLSLSCFFTTSRVALLSVPSL